METTSRLEAAPERDSASIWEDFVDIFYAPSEVFARRRDGRFGLALLILTVLMGILYYASHAVLAEAMQAELARGIEGQQISAEQMEMAQRMAGVWMLVGLILTFPIGVLVAGAALWLVGKAFGSVAGFAAALMVATYAQAPWILQQLSAILQGLVMEPVTSLYHVTLSPARFFDPDQTSAVTMELLGRLDVFVVWSTILLGIGLAVVGRIPRSHGYAAAAVVWLLGSLPILVGTLF